MFSSKVLLHFGSCGHYKWWVFGGLLTVSKSLSDLCYFQCATGMRNRAKHALFVILFCVDPIRNHRHPKRKLLTQLTCDQQRNCTMCLLTRNIEKSNMPQTSICIAVCSLGCFQSIWFSFLKYTNIHRRIQFFSRRLECNPMTRKSAYLELLTRLFMYWSQ